MKKSLLTAFVLVAVATGLAAQGLGFGIKGGINLANQKIDASDQYIDPDDVKSRFGIHGGVFLTFMFSDNLGIQPELLYSQQGSTSNWDTDEFKTKVGYVTLPVLLRYNINEMFSLHAGPQFGFLMSAKEEYEGADYDIKEDFKGSDIGLAFGVEVDLPAKLGIGARYVAGLSDIVKEEGSWGGYSLKNSVIQIYAKFRILGD